MQKNKKKAPGRPKKEFVSKKPKTKIKSGPGRPRKDHKDRVQHTAQVIPEITSFVAKSVDGSKKKDMIILGLFSLSFILFIVSLYYTFMRDRSHDAMTQQGIGEITNIQNGNIDYEASDTLLEEKVKVMVEDPQTQETIQQIVQQLSPEQQLIVDFYQAVNTLDMNTIHILTDGRLEESNVFKTYYSRRWLTNFSEIILAPKIVVSNIQEVTTASTNPNIKNFEYIIEYTLASNQQKFTEKRSTTLIKRGNNRRIGKLMCETKGCSTMPFFNPEKYK